jgi:hypothetical protein
LPLYGGASSFSSWKETVIRESDGYATPQTTLVWLLLAERIGSAQERMGIYATLGFPIPTTMVEMSGVK